MAFPNLFEYLTFGIGYSAASAQRRIDAARLMHEVPSLGEKIESGSVSLNQVSFLQKSIRGIKNTKQIKISKEKKQELIEKICGQSFKETEQILAQELDLPINHIEKHRTQQDESVRVEITFSKEQLELLIKLEIYLAIVCMNTICMVIV